MYDAQDLRLRHEKQMIRGSAGYIGIMMLAIEGSMFLLGLLLSFVNELFSLDLTTYLLWYSAVYAAGMAGSAIVVSLLCGRRHFPLSPARSLPPADAFYGVLATVGICMGANIVVNILMLFFESAGIPEPQMPDFLQATPVSLILNLFVFALLPALLEELVFRGYVLRELRAYGDWFAVTVSALLFGLMHGNIAQIPFALIVGFALGWLYVMTNNICIPVAVHFINNGFSLLLQYCCMGMDDENANKMSAFAMFMLIVIGALALAVLIKRRSMLFRRLPRRTEMAVWRRIGALLSSPMFWICVAVFVLMTVLDVLGSMKLDG